MKNSPKRKKSQRTLRFWLEYIIYNMGIVSFFEGAIDLPLSTIEFLEGFADDVLCACSTDSIIVPLLGKYQCEYLGSTIFSERESCNLEINYESWFFFLERLEESRIGEWETGGLGDWWTRRLVGSETGGLRTLLFLSCLLGKGFGLFCHCSFTVYCLFCCIGDDFWSWDIRTFLRYLRCMLLFFSLHASCFMIEGISFYST